MDYKKLLESDSLSPEELLAMKQSAYAAMPYEFYLILRELNKPAIIENADKFNHCRKQAIEFLNIYKQL